MLKMRFIWFAKVSEPASLLVLKEARSKPSIQTCKMLCYPAIRIRQQLKFLYVVGPIQFYSDSWSSISDGSKDLLQLKSGVGISNWPRRFSARLVISRLAISLLWGLKISAIFSSEILTLCRCLGILADKITQSTSMEDRKIRKELQVCNSIVY